MNINRRQFIQTLAIAAATGLDLRHSYSGEAKQNINSIGENSKLPIDLYEFPPFGNVSLIHTTDIHAQLMPMHYREASTNIGVGEAKNKIPHIVGNSFLKYYGIAPLSATAHSLTSLNFSELARKYGKMGGYAYIATLINTIRAQRNSSLLLDGGDNWQGSATSLWTNAQDMIDANKLLGLDIMTGHWEFTYGANRIRHVIENDFKNQTDFIAQNVIDTEFGDRVFVPYIMKEQNGVRIAVVGQAFPYTSISNPSYMFPHWSFGIQEQELQETVILARAEGAQAVVLLSHNGLDVDLKLASRVSGIDAILGGHSHDPIPKPVIVSNSAGKTIVINTGSAGKFVSLLDLDIQKKKVVGYQYRLLPVYSNLIQTNTEMENYIQTVRKPFLPQLEEKLAVSEGLLYRRGTFSGSFDQLIIDAMMETFDADIVFTPGFRWGMSVLPGETITFENVMANTAITYPITDVNYLTGERIKLILEDVADNLFNKDPYYQQGGDMLRVGGLEYSIDPNENIGKRISGMTVRGKPIGANKTYKVAGWAVVSEYLEGIPIWDVVANYLRDRKSVSINKLNKPKLINIKSNKGIS